MPHLTRRALLGLGATAAGGVVVGGVGVAAAIRSRPSTAPGPAAPSARTTFEQWRATRAVPYLVGYRGAADVAPEHTLPGYQAALDGGARAIEVSVVRSADGVLYCLQDLTLDRTTTARGRVSATRSDRLDLARVAVPRLGTRWVGTSMPPLPRLDDVLAALGGRAVLCLEARDDKAYGAMMARVESAGLQDSVMIKVSGSAVRRVEDIRQAGYPVCASLEDDRAVTAKDIELLGRRLDPRTDALVLPSTSEGNLFPAELVRRAVDTGVGVWVSPVHRRHELAHFSRLGIEGFVSPDLGYLAQARPPLRVDDWAGGTMTLGQLTRDPSSDAFALHWEDEGTIGLDVQGGPAFVSLGQFGPVDAPSYRISFDATFDPMPTDTWQHLSIAFGHADDRYYEHRIGTSDGYHAQLRADGSMGIYAHVQGDPNGRQLAPTQSSPPFRAGVWTRLLLDVSPGQLRWTRDSGNSVSATDPRFRGGYFHIGRSGSDGRLKIKNLSIT